MILALDLGTNLGYCVEENGKITLSGCINLGNKEERVRNFINFLQDIYDSNNLELVYYEKVTFSTNTYADQFHGLMKGTLESFCYERKITCHGIPVQTIKKVFTGKGNASKMAMVHYAELLTGSKIYNDNEADAIGVLYTGKKLGLK